MAKLGIKERAALHELDTGERQKLSQAQRVIARFNGAPNLARALGCHESTVFKWTYPRAKQGSDGIIPSCAMKRVMRVARAEGILLTPEDLYPGDR